MQNIKADKKLSEFLENIKTQKKKIETANLVQSVIRKVVKDFNNYFKALKKYKKNPEKFRAKPNPPKPKKLSYLMDFSVEGNRNVFKLVEDNKLPKDFGYEITSFRLKLLVDDLYVDVVRFSGSVKQFENWRISFIC